VSEKSINEIVAANLAFWMAEAGITQTALATKALVSQKTISNYLNPNQRNEGSTGKSPSAKLTELDRVAKALNIETWQLVRAMTPAERRAFNAIERAYGEFTVAAVAAEPMATQFVSNLEDELEWVKSKASSPHATKKKVR
jgi:transcriptional regulator with XRE-family HTH domain